MSEILKIIGISAGSSLLFSGVIIWLFKNWISERLKSAIAYEYTEKLKTLEHGYNQQLEKLRAQLQSDSFRLKEEMEHDRKIFERLVSYCDETTFRDVCVTIADYQFYDYEYFKRVRDVEHYGIQDENRFLNQSLREAFEKFHKSLDAFTTIVATNFFATSEGRYMLYPELKYSDDEEERRQFEQARTETNKAGYNALEAFSGFRQVVKETLYV